MTSNQIKEFAIAGAQLLGLGLSIVADKKYFIKNAGKSVAVPIFLAGTFAANVYAHVHNGVNDICQFDCSEGASIGAGYENGEHKMIVESNANGSQINLVMDPELMMEISNGLLLTANNKEVDICE